MSILDPSLIAVVTINLLLMIFAGRILAKVYHESREGEGFARRVRLFQILNGVIVASFVGSRLFDNGADESVGYAIFSILTILYLGFAAVHLLNYWVRKRYGRCREIDGKQQLFDTYNSRLINIFVTTFVSIVVLVSIVRVMGFDSLLEAGGAIGIVGVFLALTQSAWAPDIISGLIILNSKMMDVGDVIEFNDGNKSLGVIFKTRIFYTEILNISNNHRIMIKNSRLRDQTIHNLSKFASAKGLRESLSFKIGYEVDEAQVKGLFEKAFEQAKQQGDINFESQYPLEYGINDTGDYAVEWCCYYYTKDIRSVIATRQKMRAVILAESKRLGISLATPELHAVQPVSDS